MSRSPTGAMVFRVFESLHHPVKKRVDVSNKKIDARCLSKLLSQMISLRFCAKRVSSPDPSRLC